MNRVRIRFAALYKVQGRRLLLVGVVLMLALLMWRGVWGVGRERLAFAEHAYEQQVVLAKAIVSAQAAAAPPETSLFSVAWLNSSAIAAGLTVQSLDFNLEHIQFSARGDGGAVVQWLHRLEQQGGKIVSLSLQRIEQALEVRISLLAPKEPVQGNNGN